MTEKHPQARDPCVTPRCINSALSGRPFCGDCQRVVNDEERRALGVIHRAPFYGPGAWGDTEGKNVLWVFDGPKRMDGRATKSTQDASDALHWLEYRLCAMAIGKRIARDKLKRLARRRLTDRRRR